MSSKIIAKKDVEYTAELARLELSKGELEKYVEDLNAILGYFQDLAKADISEEVKINHYDFVSGRKNLFRPDKVNVSGGEVKKIIKDNFPSRKGNLLVVKSVMTKK